MNNKIEFINEEAFCRYNGVLMNEEGCLKIFGYKDNLDMLDNNTIIIEDKIYSDKDIADLIRLIGIYNKKTPEWDVIFNQGYEPGAVTERRKIDDTYTLSQSDIDIFDGIREILPFEKFKKDYPEISIEKYLEFSEALDKYYNELMK